MVQLGHFGKEAGGIGSETKTLKTHKEPPLSLGMASLEVDLVKDMSMNQLGPKINGVERQQGCSKRSSQVNQDCIW